MRHLFSGIDLSRGRAPEEFYTCLIEDPMKVEEWRASDGAHDHTIPSSNWCALTCLRMILLLEGREAPSLEYLWERACAAGVYVLGAGNRGWIGAYHERLASFIKEFGFDAINLKDLTMDLIAEALSSGNYVIPSVSPDIRYALDLEPRHTDGHMVLCYKYQIDEPGRMFTIQNSAGFASIGTQIGVPIPEARFRQVFSGNAILVRSSL
jgi:hypothetical protein